MPGTVAVFLPWLWLGPFDTSESGWMMMTIGGVVTLAGLVLYLACVLPFARVGRGTPAPIDAPVHLVVVGPYRFVRNPMYLAVLSVVFGQAIIATSTTLALYGAGVFALFAVMVLGYEEPTLRDQFGDEYRDYCARVPRWIPALGKEDSA